MSAVSTWYAKFKQDLDKSITVANQVPDAYSVARRVIDLPAPNAEIFKNSVESSGPDFSFGSYLQNSLNGASLALNILDQPRSAIVNSISEFEKPLGNTPFFSSDKKSEALGGALSGFWEGLKGDAHTGSADLLRQEGDAIKADGGTPGVGQSEGFGNGVMGFFGDVLLDPLTYIPGGIIAKAGKEALGGVKTGGEALGWLKKGEEAAAGTKTLATDGAKVAEEVAKPPIPAPVELPKPVQPELPMTIPEQPAKQLPSAFMESLKNEANKLNDAAIEPVPLTSVAQRPNKNLAADIFSESLKARKAELASHLDNVPSTHLRDANIPSLYTSTVDKAGLKAAQTAHKATQDALEAAHSAANASAAMSVQQKAGINTVYRLMNDVPEKFGLASNGLHQLTSPEAIPDLMPMINNVLKTGKLPNGESLWNQAIRHGDLSNRPAPLNAKQYFKAIASGKVPETLARTTVRKNGNAIPLAEYAASRNKKWSTFKPEPVANASKFVRETFDPSSIQPITDRVKGKDLDKWIASAKKAGLSDADIQSLRKVRSADSFKKRLAEIKNTPVGKKFDSIDSLEAAVKAGHVTKEDALSVYQKMDPKAKTAQGARQAMSKIDKALADNGVRVDELMAEKGAIATKIENALGVKITGRQFPIETAKDILFRAENTRLSSLGSPTIVATAEQTVLASRVATKLADNLATRLKYKYRRPSGALAEKPAGKKGDVWHQSINKMDYITIHKAIMQELDALPEIARLPSGHINPAAAYPVYMKSVELIEGALKKHGLEPILGDKGTGIPLSYYDVLTSLKPGTVSRYVVDIRNQIQPQQLMDAAELSMNWAALTGRSLGETFDFSQVGIKEFQNVLDGIRHAMTTAIAKIPKTANGERVLDAAGQAELITAVTDSKFAKALNRFEAKATAKYGAENAAAQARHMYDKIEQEILSAGSDFLQKAENNSARIGLEFGQKVELAKQSALDSFIIAYQSARTGDEVANAVENMAKISQAAARAVDEPIGDIIKDSLKAEADRIGVEVAQLEAEIKGASHFAEQTTKSGQAFVRHQMAESADNALSDILGETYDVGLAYEKEMASSGYRFIKAIFPAFKSRDLTRMFLLRDNAANQAATSFTEQLGKIARSSTPEAVKSAWEALQRGVTVEDPAVARVQEMLRSITGNILHTEDGTGFMHRLGVDPEHVNGLMARYGIPDSIKFTGDGVDQMAQSWRQWELKDPLDTLHRVYAAITHANAENRLGRAVMQDYGKVLSAGEKVPEGYVRLRNSTNKINPILNTLDIDGMVYKKEIAEQIPNLQYLLDDMRKAPKHSDVLRMYDSAQHMWKSAMTVYRLGHHIRNEFGDIFNCMMDGMTDPRWLKRGMEGMKYRSELWDDFSLTSQKLLSQTDYKVTQAGEKALTFKVGGKEYDLSHRITTQLAGELGTFPSVATMEDLTMSTGAADATHLSNMLRDSKANPLHWLSKVPGSKIQPGDVRKAVTDFSAYREHHIRYSHFLYALKDEIPKVAKSVKDPAEVLRIASEKAAGRVYKFHPDGSGLSSIERNWARRIIPFYSWTRKMVPVVIESMVMRPGRFMLYPKAAYNFAEAQGIDLQSMGDPFPTDQLFPEWMSQQHYGIGTGTPGNYFQIKTGEPGIDILDQYFTSPTGTVRSVGGQVAPWLRAGPELMSGSTWATGAKITSPRDYITSSVPGFSLVDKLLGDDFKQATGGYIAKSNQGYESQLHTPLGTMDSGDIALSNWLTGISLTDASKPSYIKSAQFDMKDRIKKQIQASGG